MRKRHTARPRLETMEMRVVPSAVGVHQHTEQVIAAHVSRVHAHDEKVATNRTDRREAALRHHHHVKHTPAVHDTETAAAKTAAAKAAATAGDRDFRADPIDFEEHLSHPGPRAPRMGRPPGPRHVIDLHFAIMSPLRPGRLEPQIAASSTWAGLRRARSCPMFLKKHSRNQGGSAAWQGVRPTL